MSSKLFAVVAGAGTGTGRAAALRFAKAYPVVLLARSEKSYQDTVSAVEKAGGKAIGISTDVTDPKSVSAAFEKIESELPGHKLAAAVYNVASGYGSKPFLESSVEEWDASVSGNARGFFIFAQATMPLLLDAVSTSERPPTLIATGASSAMRGSAKFATMASGMFARRAINQSLAREFGPQGVHVAHAIIDGLIDNERTAGYTANKGVEGGKLDPNAIAESYWHLHTQPRSTWTQELDLRPFVETF